MVVDTDEPATQAAFGDLVGVTQQQVSALVDRGVLDREATLGRWLLAYTANLREQAAGRSAMQANERARFEKLKADRQEMINAQMRGELVPVDLLEQILADGARRIVVLLEALPARFVRELPNVDPVALALLQDEIARARNEAAELEFPEEVLHEYLRRGGAPDAMAKGLLDVSSPGPAPAVAMG